MSIEEARGVVINLHGYNGIVLAMNAECHHAVVRFYRINERTDYENDLHAITQDDTITLMYANWFVNVEDLS